MSFTATARPEHCRVTFGSVAFAAMLEATRLALVAGFLVCCGSDGRTATRARVDEPEAREGGTDARVESVCSFTPCGGDLLGSWTIQTACLASILVPNCPGAALDPKDVTVTGNFTFGSDGTLAIDIATSGTWQGLVPPSCVAGTDCPSIAVTLFQPNAPPATCTSNADGGCTCSSPATPTQTGSRPYRISGTTAASMSFCVQDDVLKLMNEAGTVFVSRRAPPP
jgi:hypothetical protein